MIQQNIEFGRTKIDDSRRQNQSVRSADGKLDVLDGFCPNCHHTKIFHGNTLTSKGQGIIKCCKCKHIMNKI